MSFIAALILMYVDDEALAWTVFVRVLQICDWRRLYLLQTPKLFELTSKVRNIIVAEMPGVNALLIRHNVILESLFASPFLTLFSNLIPIDQALRVLDSFILHGEPVIIEIMKHLLKRKEKEIEIMDCWEL